MIYWVFSFARPDVERREFSPRMQQMMLTLAKTAKIAREELPQHGLSGLKDSKPA
jgi:hypothetical protein